MKWNSLDEEVSKKLTLVLRVTRISIIIFSIIITYHTMVVLKNYEILTNPGGPDTSDYFEE